MRSIGSFLLPLTLVALTKMPSVKSITLKRMTDFPKVGGGEVVFCNPPYGRELPKWVKKCYEESRHADVVMLIPARTDTRWFHDYIYGKAEIRFIKGRLKFGNAKQSAPFPSMVVIYRASQGVQM